MKIKILSQKYNPLLKRKEVIFEVDHSQEGQTPPRAELRKNLANMLKTKIDLIFVEKVKTKTGTTTALGEATAYESAEQAKLIEPEHIIARNIPPQKPEEQEKAKTSPEETKPAKEEKPEEAKPKGEKEAKPKEPPPSKPEEEPKEAEKEE